MNALLITPRIYDFTAFNYWLYPLIEMLTADFLEKSGYSVSYVNGLEYEHPRKNDRFGKSPLASIEIPKPAVLQSIPKKFKIFGKNIQTYKQQIQQSPSPDIVIVFQKMTYWYLGVIEAIDIVKEYHPHSKIIIGGNTAVLLKDFYAAKNINYDVIGSFQELKSSLNISNEISITDLVPKHDLLMHTTANVNFMASITTFGCPFKCSYCINSIKNSKLVYRPVELVVAELVTTMNKYNIKDLAFYDDYVVSNNNIIEILRSVKSKINDARFHFPNGLPVSRLINYLKDFKELSVQTFALGFESLENGKNTDKEYIALFEEIEKLGFEHSKVGINVMIGLPKQQYKDVMDTLGFIKKYSKGYSIKLNEYSPIPSTQAANLYLEETEIDFVKEPLWQNNSLLGFRGVNEFCDSRIKELKILIKENS